MSKREPFLSRILIFRSSRLIPSNSGRRVILSSGALEHDRTWALFDEKGKFVNGKRHAAVHRLRSEIDIEAHAVTLRDESGRGLGSEAFRSMMRSARRLAQRLFRLSHLFREKLRTRFSRRHGFARADDHQRCDLSGNRPLVRLADRRGAAAFSHKYRNRRCAAVLGGPALRRAGDDDQVPHRRCDVRGDQPLSALRRAAARSR